MTDWHKYSYTRKQRTDRIRHLPKPPPGYYWRDNGTTSYWLRTDPGPQGGVGFVEATGHGKDIKSHHHRYLLDENGIAVAEIGQMGIDQYQYMKGWTCICFGEEFGYGKRFTADIGQYDQLQSLVKFSTQRELETIHRGKRRIQPPLRPFGIGSEAPVWEDPKHPGWRKWKRSRGYNMDDYRLQKPVKW